MASAGLAVLATNGGCHGYQRGIFVADKPDYSSAHATHSDWRADQSHDSRVDRTNGFSAVRRDRAAQAGGAGEKCGCDTPCQSAPSLYNSQRPLQAASSKERSASLCSLVHPEDRQHSQCCPVPLTALQKPIPASRIIHYGAVAWLVSGSLRYRRSFARDISARPPGCFLGIRR